MGGTARGEAPRATRDSLLTVLRVVSAAAVAAYVFDLFPDLTVDCKRHVVVVRMLAVPLPAAQRHDLNQAEGFFLGLLHGHGRVFSAPRGEPGAVHDGGRRIHRRVIGRFEHGGSCNSSAAFCCAFFSLPKLAPSVES